MEQDEFERIIESIDSTSPNAMTLTQMVELVYRIQVSVPNWNNSLAYVMAKMFNEDREKFNTLYQLGEGKGLLP